MHRTRIVRVGTVPIGGDEPISIQSMWKERLDRIDPNLLRRIEKLSDLGCDLLRFAVPDLETAEVLGKLSREVAMPLIADIHFDYKIALRCMDFTIAKIRINPGNIGAPWKVKEVIQKAKDRGLPLRIGVNAGSLPRKLREEKDVASAMVKAAEQELEILSSLDFHNVIFSLKSSGIESTISANLAFASKYDYPLHLGITEAGPLIPGIVRNTIGLHRLLQAGLGNTVRISLSEEPESEIMAAREILAAENKYNRGVKIIACPKCGRSSFDVHSFLQEAGEFLYSVKKNITVAIMGCVVNGPEEARHVDIGITGAGKEVIIFKHGAIIHKIRPEKAFETFKEEIENL
ncbi:MAG: flavodoxin-dependent (E)-4-hydroxy-3-methylbut-2-enyl-diphosphate synthase [Spirochaetota bacterium]